MIREVIVVEGKDDIAAVKRAVDCEIIATGGYHFPKDLFRRIKKAYEKKGVIVLTDPDYAGERIRKIINKRIPGVKNAYLPQRRAIKKDDIGIENASPKDILYALKTAKASYEKPRDEFSYQDLIDYGLTGFGSKELRVYIGEYFSIGYANGKQFLKRLNNYNIDRKLLEEAILKYHGK
ncbi:ribonuclease M5 [Lagierella sp.]|uniref:ribonuclease M5 n=1 Tax=Lagierella sp. TaxID=2849657 RepID=UPI00261E2F7B|nr:ribonuclease M5 [Lagierella sp.]